MNAAGAALVLMAMQESSLSPNSLRLRVRTLLGMSLGMPLDASHHSTFDAMADALRVAWQTMADRARGVPRAVEGLDRAYGHPRAILAALDAVRTSPRPARAWASRSPRQAPRRRARCDFTTKRSG